MKQIEENKTLDAQDTALDDERLEQVDGGNWDSLLVPGEQDLEEP